METRIGEAELAIVSAVYLGRYSVYSPAVVEIGLMTVIYKLNGAEGVHIVIRKLNERVRSLLGNLGHSEA